MPLHGAIGHAQRDLTLRQRLPGTVMAVTGARIVEDQRKDIGGVRATRGHGPGDVTVVPESDVRRAGKADATAVQLTGVDTHLPESGRTEPVQVRVDEEHRVTRRRPRGGDGELVRTPRRSGESRLDAAPTQVTQGLVDGPVVEKHAPERIRHGRLYRAMAPP